MVGHRPFAELIEALSVERAQRIGAAMARMRPATVPETERPASDTTQDEAVDKGINDKAGTGPDRTAGS